MRTAFVLLALVALAAATCPFADKNFKGPNPHRQAELPLPRKIVTPTVSAAQAAAVAALNWSAVEEDIVALLTESQPYYPADFGNYGPFFVRQAWHCTGSYRVSDGNGGCDGGRQRFDPERSWDDNTNLDKAKRLLQPLKVKYGAALSWGDLIVFAGTTAIKAMGGPVLGFCAGRIDDNDGTDSLFLGPTPEQEALYPCAQQGNCKSPLGTDTVGLIYVNPEGPLGKPDPVGSVSHIRDVFGRMTMNDQEIVALIGGGHAFGKAHGACPNGPGAKPKDDPANPWPQPACPNGIVTSGFEGAWTSTPTQWGNEYFQNLVNYNWTAAKGPGGHFQWSHVSDGSGFMFTTDVALTKDKVFNSFVKKYAADVSLLDTDFAAVWYKLVTRDMGPVSRCLGDRVPPAQRFQYPLPAPLPASQLANFDLVRSSLDTLFARPNVDVAAFVHLATQAATTFRRTDYRGGANGARIRLAPESQWPTNAGTQGALKLLAPIKGLFGKGLSWADLIVFAGVHAIVSTTGQTVLFCPGRVDAPISNGASANLVNLNYDATIAQAAALQNLLGLTDAEWVALAARPRSTSLLAKLGFNAANIGGSIGFFQTLLNNTWTAVPSQSTGKVQYQSEQDASLFVTPLDLTLIWDAPKLAIVQNYAAGDNADWLADLAAAWYKLTQNDRFAGPFAKACDA